MTDLEKINRPVVYKHVYGSTHGFAKTCEGEDLKYIFNDLLKNKTFVVCFSFLDDDKVDIIAGFRVTKIHDTRRENN